MRAIKIIGVGSPFGDDQLGWRIIEALEKQSGIIQLGDKIFLEKCDRPGANLIKYLQSSDTVILIDAMKTSSKPGKIHRFENAEIGTLDNLLSTHNFGITEALKLARALGDIPKSIILYGIEINTLDMHNNFSETINIAIDQLTKCIETEIYAILR